jgi:hypothetical protein
MYCVTCLTAGDRKACQTQGKRWDIQRRQSQRVRTQETRSVASEARGRPERVKYQRLPQPSTAHRELIL